MADFATFVFTDLVGSVDLKSRLPGATAAERDEAYVRLVLSPHRERIEAGLQEAGGRVVSTAGDGHFLVFTDTVKAAAWALAVQKSHAEAPIEVGEGHRAEVRIGIHAGVPQRDPHDSGNYIGRPVDYASRLADQADAGQVLASRSVASLLEDAGLRTLKLHNHGRRRLRGIGEVELHELVPPGGRPGQPRGQEAPPDQRNWTVLPATMGITEYRSQGSASAAPAATIAEPTRIGNYELGELIGAGGMGNVYKARHKQFGKQRAIKLIRPELMEGGGESVVRRFYQEVHATGSLEHPNLVVAIDSSTPEDDQHYLVMEYIEGVGVDRLLAEHGTLGVGAACEIIRQAALGLQHLNSRSLVHRDIKPSNLMVALVDDPAGSTGVSSEPTKAATVKLMDLGLALLATGDRERVTRIDQGGMGTGYYMSPEQWRTTSVDIRADIYSLGCTLFHLLTGAPPYAKSDLRPQRAHEREAVPSVVRETGAPPKLDALVRRMMAKRPDDRPQDPLAVAQALEPLADRDALTELIAEVQASPAPRVNERAQETRGPRQAAFDTRRQTPLGSTLSKAAEHARWLAPTAIALVAALLAINLAWLIGDLRQQMVAKHRDTLRRTADATAKQLAVEIEGRFDRLAVSARSPRLVEWLTAIAAAPDDDALWDDPQAWILAQRSDADQLHSSKSWFLTDAAGLQIARAPEKATIGSNFSHRDYFHGQGVGDHSAAAPLPPIETEHLSAVYSSSRTGELKVAFSTPVFNGKRGRAKQVIGVLGMSVELGQFKTVEDAKENEAASDNALIELVEVMLADLRTDEIEDEPKRGLVLHHPSLVSKDAPVRLSPSLLQQIEAASRGEMLEGYDDPFGRDDHLWAATARVVLRGDRDTEWVIVAQEPKP